MLKIKVNHKGHKEKKLQIKFDVDIDPPLYFETESKYILQPVPFSVRVYKPSFLFAGKVHALLFRKWKNRVKGRDWYDFVWFIAQSIPLNINHLAERIRQSGHWPMDKYFSREDFFQIYHRKIDELNLEQAKNDIAPSLRDASVLEVWSQEFFLNLGTKISFEG